MGKACYAIPRLQLAAISERQVEIRNRQKRFCTFTNFAYPYFKNSCGDIERCFTPFITNERIGTLFC